MLYNDTMLIIYFKHWYVFKDNLILHRPKKNGLVHKILKLILAIFGALNQNMKSSFFYQFYFFYTYPFIYPYFFYSIHSVKDRAKLTLRDIRDKTHHWVRKKWPKRENMDFGEKDVINVFLIGREKIIFLPLHIKLGLMKQFI